MKQLISLVFSLALIISVGSAYADPGKGAGNAYGYGHCKNNGKGHSKGKSNGLHGSLDGDCSGTPPPTECIPPITTTSFTTVNIGGVSVFVTIKTGGVCVINFSVTDLGINPLACELLTSYGDLPDRRTARVTDANGTNYLPVEAWFSCSVE